MFCARTVVMLVMPKTKQMASNILDFPLPLRPVMELKLSSQPLMTVRTAYDLKPSITISTTFIFDGRRSPVTRRRTDEGEYLVCLPDIYCLGVLAWILRCHSN